MASLSHFDNHGSSRMVDVSAKQVTSRHAAASGVVRMQRNTLQVILDQKLAKGNVFEVARIAAIMAAKRTSELIPLCHPLPIVAVDVEIEPREQTSLFVRATCKVDAKTGVEMEALTAVSVACLTIYDMCKAIDREIEITDIRLDEKSGGRSGHFARSPRDASAPKTPTSEAES